MLRTLWGRVLIVGLATLVGAVLFELVAYLVGMDASFWGRHLATIAFETAVASLVASAVFRTHDDLRRQIAEQETLARARAEAALARELETDREIADLGAALLAAGPDDDEAALILRAAERTTGSAFGYVGYIDPQSEHLIRPVLSQDVWDACQIPTNEPAKTVRGLSGWVLRNRKPLYTNDPASDPRSEGTPPGHVPIVRFLSAPALAGDVLLGQIALANAPQDYTERDVSVVQRLANLYGLALRRKWAEEGVREALQAAAQSEQRYRELYEGIPVAVYRTRPDGQVLDGNQALNRLLGCPDRATLLGLNAVDLYADPLERERQWDLLRETGAVQRAKLRLRRLDGHTFWVRNTMRGEWGEDGQILYVEGSLEDVTEEHAAEQLREDMTHMLVHDLRSPLGNTANALELLSLDARRVYTEDERTALEIACRNAHRMQQLVDTILEVSQLESGQVTLDRVLLDPAEIITEALRMQAPQTAARGLHLSSRVPPCLPPVSADRQMVARVLQNLLDNAIKYAAVDGSVSIDARVDGQPGPASLRIAVTNDGPELEEEVRQRLFTKFSRGQHARRGSGLGLAFCKLAVEAHGGRIWAEPAPGQGTTFSFTLPVA